MDFAVKSVQRGIWTRLVYTRANDIRNRTLCELPCPLRLLAPKTSPNAFIWEEIIATACLCRYMSRTKNKPSKSAYHPPITKSKKKPPNPALPINVTQTYSRKRRKKKKEKKREILSTYYPNTYYNSPPNTSLPRPAISLFTPPLAASSNSLTTPATTHRLTFASAFTNASATACEHAAGDPTRPSTRWYASIRTSHSVANV